MSNQVRKTSLLNIYHVIYRGVNKQLIFEDDEDYRTIIRTLRKCAVWGPRSTSASA